MPLAPVSRSHWLENSPRKAKARKRRSSSRGKRRPPNGFRTWSAYMDSIRPGGKMARRRRRRRSTSSAAPRRRRRRRNPPTMAANPRRRRRRSVRRRNPVMAVNRRRRRRSVFSVSRRRYRRNPRFSVRGIIGQAQTAAVTAVQIVGGKVATRVIRNYIPGGKPVPGQPLTPTQILIELGAATAVGYLGSMFLGAKMGANFMAGGFVGVVESLVKTYKIPIAADALGDDGDPNVITVPAHMSGYVREAIGPALSGYVQDGADVNGPGLGAYGPSNASGIVADDSGVFADIGIG
jgi:hypothetical protein